MSPEATAPTLPPASAAATTPLRCMICGHVDTTPDASSFGTARGNTQRFIGHAARLWACPACRSIHNIDPVDLEDIYRDYVLKNWKLDYFARSAYRNLLGRLRKAGWRPGQSILDIGCGSGVFLDYLKQRGIPNAQGYDPFVPPYTRPPALGTMFDCVVANDVIEHTEDPKAMLAEWVSLLKPGGLLYVSTVDAGAVRLDKTEEHLMCLHQPFHRVMVTPEVFERTCRETGLEMVAFYRRSYMDTCRPFVNRRFLGEFNRALGDNIDRTFDPAAQRIVGRRPRLWFYGLFGYLFPRDFEPAAILRKR